MCRAQAAAVAFRCAAAAAATAALLSAATVAASSPCHRLSPGVPARSASNCSVLGWQDLYGSSRVCGESDSFGAMQCSSPTAPCQRTQGCLNTSLAGAVHACHSIGARVCSEAELLTNEARGTGCGYDGERVWSISRGSCFHGFRRSLAGCENRPPAAAPPARPHAHARFPREEPEACKPYGRTIHST